MAVTYRQEAPWGSSDVGPVKAPLLGAVSFREQAPFYGYVLVCGHVFCSDTPADVSEPMYCRHCESYANPEYCDEGLRTMPGSYRDMRVADAQDRAIKRDRIADLIRCGYPGEEVAEMSGVSRSTVVTIGLEIGVYESRESAHARPNPFRN